MFGAFGLVETSPGGEKGDGPTGETAIGLVPNCIVVGANGLLD